VATPSASDESGGPDWPGSGVDEPLEGRDDSADPGADRRCMGSAICICCNWVCVGMGGMGSPIPVAEPDPTPAPAAAPAPPVAKLLLMPTLLGLRCGLETGEARGDNDKGVGLKLLPDDTDEPAVEGATEEEDDEDNEPKWCKGWCW
jgi:hypothetical protein